MTTFRTAKLEEALEIRAWAKPVEDGDPDWSTVVFADERPGDEYYEVFITI
jgi:hypothetical protein